MKIGIKRYDDPVFRPGKRKNIRVGSAGHSNFTNMDRILIGLPKEARGTAGQTLVKQPAHRLTEE